MEQPDSTNSIYEGVGGRDYNADGTHHHQDGGEPTATDAHACRYMTQEYRYAVLKALM